MESSNDCLSWILRCGPRWYFAAKAGVLMNALEGEEQQHDRSAKSRETRSEVVIFRFMSVGNFRIGE
jgi:hypothetical protein